MNDHQLEPKENEPGRNEDVLSGWEFIDNHGRSVADWLRSCLSRAVSAEICVAYFTPTGLEVIKDEIEDFLGKGGFLSIITSEEISKADARSLLKLAERYPSVQARVYPAEVTFMHSKVYLLEDGKRTRVLVGSSNLAIGGLRTNIESNLAGSFHSDHQMVRH